MAPASRLKTRKTRPYECDVCHGIGWLRNPAWNLGLENTRPYLVECTCGIIAARRLQRWNHLYGYEGWLLDADFDGWQERPADPGAGQRRNAAKVVQNWAETIANNRAAEARNLVLIGGYGTGKTHLAAAAVNLLRSVGVVAAFANVPALLDTFRSAFREGAPYSFDDNFEAIRRVPVLALDDFGAHYATPWAVEKLYEIINTRIVLQLPMLITTNTPLEEADPRIASRLRPAQMVDCGSFDYRQVKQ